MLQDCGMKCHLSFTLFKAKSTDTLVYSITTSNEINEKFSFKFQLKLCSIKIFYLFVIILYVANRFRNIIFEYLV